MSRIKRSSSVSDIFKQRLAGMKSIDPKLDLGNGITVEEGEKLGINFDTGLQEYNMTLSTIDEKQFKLDKMEEDLDVFASKILAAVAVKYGKDSIEYEKVGGKRLSEIKRKKRDAKPKTDAEKTDKK